MIRYREGMSETDYQKMMTEISELDAAYARNTEEACSLDEDDEAFEEAAFYEELRREFRR